MAPYNEFVRGANTFIMTSQERHEARFQRRKAKRLERKQARCDSLGPTNKIFSYRKMFFYGKKCCNGVRWKQSVQNFEGHLFSGTATRRRTVLEQTWKPKSCSHFTLRERGKIRPIDAPHIPDRQIPLAVQTDQTTAWMALPAIWPGRCCVAVGFERVLSKCFPCPVISAAPGIDFES